ncbi:MATE family efflux transporter [Clostridiaceae bacterium M8S5]|nr:MATE family efflux transporter [Clostridiaceae bacterium M8S5]
MINSKIKEGKTILAMAIGLSLGQLSQVLISLTDVKMVSVLGEKALSAATLASLLNLLISLFSMGCIIVIPPMIGEAKGANDKNKIYDITKNGYIMCLLLIIVHIVFYLACIVVLRFIIPDSSITHSVTQYLYGLIPGIPAWILFIYIRFILASHSDVIVATVISLLGVLINFVGNYILIYQKGLNIIGSSISTSITNWLLIVLILSYYFISFAKKNELKALSTKGKISKPILKEIAFIGIPSGCTFFSEQLIFTASSMMIGSFGYMSLASYNISLQWLTVFYMLPVGLANALSIRVGQCLGERDKNKLTLSLQTVMIMLGVYVILVVLVIVFYNHKLVNLVVSKDIVSNQLLTKTSKYMYFMACIFILNSIIAIMAGIMRGFKETKIPLYFVIFIYWAWGTGLAYVLSKYFDENGLLTGLTTGLLLACIGIVIAFYKKYKHISGTIL